MKYGRAFSPDATPPCTPIRPTRRTLLRGAGGVVVGLPYLSSLLPRDVKAAVAPKRFVALTTEHGGITAANMLPPASVANQRTMLWHQVKHGSLVGGATRSGGNTIVSPVLTGSSSVLTDKLLGKMNVLTGFDIPMYLGHQSGAHLGNYVRSDQGPQNLRPFPTIDQVMAYSSKFYPTLDGITKRSVVSGYNFRGISWGWSNPAAQSGTIQKAEVTTQTKDLFSQLFTGAKTPTTTPAPAKRPLIVDRILSNYKTLRQSNRRLSPDDRRRLDDHVARLSELERRVGGVGPGAVSASCDTKAPSMEANLQSGGGIDGPTKAYGLLNDVIAMAFACGTTRVAVYMVGQNFSDYQGDWHQSVAHQHTATGPQQILSTALGFAFRATSLDLAAKLDRFEDTPGVSLLDNSLVQWTQESGIFTHDTHAMTHVTFGGAGGYFKTGQFIDYRSGLKDGYQQEHGIFHRQWLATALQAMGIPPQDFEYAGQPGYGDASGGHTGKLYAGDLFMQSSKPLPLVTNG